MALPVIFDTDMDTDCDDMGALAVLHALAARGEARILGVISDIPNPWTAVCAQAVNDFYARPQIPVGILSGEDLQTAPRYQRYREHLAEAEKWGWQRYNQPIGEAFLARNPGAPAPQDGTALYRLLLAGQAEQSVTIVAVGLLTGLQKLLDSRPDASSPLTGLELVRSRVKQLVSMGVGVFPHGQDVFNWRMDTEAAGRVLNDWPGRLVVSEWGSDVLTGAGLETRADPANPVRAAYEIYLKGPGKSRSSWDLLALLYGVRGPAGLFREKTGYRISFDARSGAHRWRPDAESKHIYLEPAAAWEAMARLLEDLMTERPNGEARQTEIE